jgi:hypothetical protein
MGKIDLQIRSKKDGRYGIMEHKTAAQINVGYVSKIAMDRQTLRYAWAAQEVSGNRMDFVVYNVIKKPGIRQKRDESFSQYVRRVEAMYQDDPNAFYREVIPLSQDLIAKVPDDDRHIVAEIDRARKIGFYQNPAHCYAYNSVCPYMRLCVEGVNPDTLADFRRKESPHEELK